MRCYDCQAEAAVLIEVKLFTVVNGPDYSYTKYVPHHFCPKCFKAHCEYMADIRK